MTNNFTKSISKKLKELYPSYKIYVDKIEQGFIEPCFFIKIVSNNLDKNLNRKRNKEISYDVMCFMDKEDEAINFDYQDIVDNLQENLELIELENNFFRTKNKESDIVDDILHFKFKLTYSLYLQESFEKIQDVKIDQNYSSSVNRFWDDTKIWSDEKIWDDENICLI